MPLQNRVSPFSTIVATDERGYWTGNRGILHNGQKEIIKNHSAKFWITCLLEYKGKRRELMTPNRWTELFFLDEATAFAAGHRPCGFCRYGDYKNFKNLWLHANGKKHGLTGEIKIDTIDAIIHKERLDENNLQKTFIAILKTLPEGVFVTLDRNQTACLWQHQTLYQWSFFGYKKIAAFDKNQPVDVLTPASYVEVFKAGYRPQVHLSAIL